MTEEAKKEIAKYAILYLKNRLMINQKIISNNENKISFEEFMNVFSKFQEKIEYLEEHPEENIIIDNTNEVTFGEKINRQKAKFVTENARFISLTESQIDELLGFVKESIETYGLNHNGSYYNETFFIREVLDTLLKKLNQSNEPNFLEKKEKIKQYKSYFYATKTMGFCEEIEGHISYEDEEFFISTHNFNKVCKINKNGINENPKNELEDEDLLIAEKMYIGKLSNQEGTICIFLEKTVNGQRKMKAISYNQELYDVLEINENSEITTSQNKAIVFDKLNDFFIKMDFDFLTSDIYDSDSFRDTINAYNKISCMSSDERKEMEEIVEIGASWWISKIYSPSFDYGIAEVKELDLLGNWLANTTGISNEKRVQIFEQKLKKKMKKLYLARPSFLLFTDYRPEGDLAAVISESGLIATFPAKTYMDISKEEITVKEGESASKEKIYSKIESVKR